MIDDKELDFVLDHVVTRICGGVGNMPEWQQLTPHQLRLVGNRLQSWNQLPGEARALVRQADELANPHAELPDDEVMRVLDNPALRILLCVGDWERDAEQVFSNRDQLKRMARKLEAFGAEQMAQADMLDIIADRRERAGR